MAHGLGYPVQGTPMGEPFDGLAIFGRFHARHTSELQVQGGRDQVCGEARIRVLCSGAKFEEDHPQSIRKQLFME